MVPKGNPKEHFHIAHQITKEGKDGYVPDVW